MFTGRCYPLKVGKGHMWRVNGWTDGGLWESLISGKFVSCEVGESGVGNGEKLRANEEGNLPFM